VSGGFNTRLPKGPQLQLQVCAECGHINYPHREICGHCLADALQWHAVDDGGVVQSVSMLHHSMETLYQQVLPLQVVSVLLDNGVVVLSHCTNTLTIGQRVRVSINNDNYDRPLLFATATQDQEG